MNILHLAIMYTVKHPITILGCIPFMMIRIIAEDSITETTSYIATVGRDSEDVVRCIPG